MEIAVETRQRWYTKGIRALQQGDLKTSIGCWLEFPLCQDTFRLNKLYLNHDGKKTGQVACSIIKSFYRLPSLIFLTNHTLQY